MSSSSDKCVLFPCLFFACLLFTVSEKHVAGEESDKVKVNLYYESLCPACQEFIVNYLVRIFYTDLGTITDLKLVPFGNAKVSDNLTITCQHGEEECKLNAIEACVIRTFPDPKTQYMFIRCVEKNTTNWESCLTNSKTKKAINDCYNSDLSKTLILEYANMTFSLKPQHKYVPWVTINTKPLDPESPDDFVAQICKAYKGKAALPKSCTSSVLSKSLESEVSKLQVSYADEAWN
ncbi:unnamed protein product [Eruca vesicaria subsp. sativa]|uniref:Gamma-interferon-inducible lysosomal thiol reductase n=1 Tax=Eruca vesicaria subsp. sativa TaxID=29727 RepID=A0ABC8LIR8_ERUVS|nr:unnamed protein product [Eruca vesicaria subsp. sativa]